MTDYRDLNFFSLLSALFSRFGEGMAFSSAPLAKATDERGLDVAAFLSAFLPQATTSLKMDGLPTTSAFVAEQSEIARLAAKTAGHQDGRIPDASFPAFSQAEKEIQAQVRDLSRQLRQRNIELLKANSPITGYSDCFEKDDVSKEIIEHAAESGISPTLIGAVKNKLLKEEEALWGGATEFMKSSLGR